MQLPVLLTIIAIAVVLGVCAVVWYIFARNKSGVIMNQYYFNGDNKAIESPIVGLTPFEYQ